MNEPHVFKNSLFALIVLIIFLCSCWRSSLSGAALIRLFPMLPFAVLGILMFGAIFLSVSSKVILTDDEITTQSLFGSKSMRWSDIGRVSGRGFNIKLHDYNEDMTVTPSPGLPGYEEIIDILGSKRPDLFSSQEYGEMRRGLGPLALLMSVLLLLLGISLSFFLSIMDTSEAPFAGLIALLAFVLFAAFAAAMVFSIPNSLTLERNSLILKYVFSEKTLLADEIASVRLSFTQSRNGKQYFIALMLTNRKSIRISGLGISLPIAYLVLKNWHAQNSSDKSKN
ncbi:MAG: PH domain-containing protein [Anaerolineales bacterium]|nr:PH domain-containing protein [Anaerolineales bacterium]